MKDKKNSKGFTLIELIAVLVIMAIIALIVTPLVLNIVRKAKDSANKRSVDAYGKSIDLAVAAYLMEKGDFPTSIDELTIEYSGKEVVCGVAKLNEDSYLYLSECTVGGVEVKDSSTEDGFYHYGKTSAEVYQTYKIGDIITYNGMNFYVIADSDENSDSVTMLKAEPLTVDEVNKYGAGHINRYTKDSLGTVSKMGDYGAMAYYTSETCGYVNGSWVEAGCTTDYFRSEVKYVVDAWAADKFQASDLKNDSLGYKSRLITYDEYLHNGTNETITTISGNILQFKPFDYINSSATYWTMSVYEDSSIYIYEIKKTGIENFIVHAYRGGYIEETIRPVVTIRKSAL